jgi:hypothetical protein
MAAAAQLVDDVPDFPAGNHKPGLQFRAFDRALPASMPPFQAVEECIRIHIRLLSPVFRARKKPPVEAAGGRPAQTACSYGFVI